MKTFFHHIDSVIELRRIFRGDNFEKVAQAACIDNEWFTVQMIECAASAICKQMLSGTKLREWMAEYEKPKDFVARRVGIIAAGNIPMVGFFDLLCAVVVGHNVSFKPSSKDRVLMEYVAGHLSTLVDNDIEIVEHIDRYDIDYLIATGSDSTAQSVRQNYRGIPSIIRNSRHSVARLRGDETVSELEGLREDIFLYFGLGCRSISHLIVPDDYDMERLAMLLHPFVGEQFAQKARYEKARLSMHSQPYIEGNGFVFCELSPNILPPVGIVGFSHYSTTEELDFSKIQCTVGMPEFSGDTAFGTTQIPSLTQYPDNIDVVKFLLQ